MFLCDFLTLQVDLNFLADRKKRKLKEIQNAKKTATRGTNRPPNNINLCHNWSFCANSSFHVI